MKYLPFISGIYSVAPGLIPFSRTDQSPNNLYFHIDEGYKKYIRNKEQCRNEHLTKYHPEFPVSKEVITPIVQFVLTQLIRENPLSFENFEGEHHNGLYNLFRNEIIRWRASTNEIEGTKYLSLFDALCCQMRKILRYVS